MCGTKTGGDEGVTATSSTKVEVIVSVATTGEVLGMFMNSLK